MDTSEAHKIGESLPHSGGAINSKEWLKRLSESAKMMHEVDVKSWREEKIGCAICQVKNIELNANKICFDCWRNKLYESV